MGRDSRGPGQKERNPCTILTLHVSLLCGYVTYLSGCVRTMMIVEFSGTREIAT